MDLTPVDRRCVTDRAAADLQKIINQHPAAFKVLLFRAVLTTEEVTDAKDVVGSVEEREKAISYQGPELTKAIELPGDLSGRYMLASGVGTLDDAEEPVVMLLQAQGVPEQSVVWIEEWVGDSVEVTTLYILSSSPIGKNGSGGTKYNFIPFNGQLREDSEQTARNEPPSPPDVSVIGNLKTYLSD